MNRCNGRQVPRWSLGVAGPRVALLLLQVLRAPAWSATRPVLVLNRILLIALSLLPQSE